jgi:hypothetical protein
VRLDRGGNGGVHGDFSGKAYDPCYSACHHRAKPVEARPPAGV